MSPRLKPVPARSVPLPPGSDDQLRVVAAILAAGLARLRSTPSILSDSETNELATAAHKSVTVPDA